MAKNPVNIIKAKGYWVTFKHYRFPKWEWQLVIAKVVQIAYAVYGYGDIYKGRHGEALRYFRGISEWEPAECGGYTLCGVFDADGQPLAAGLAECSPRDNFCYRLGRVIAAGKALKVLEEIDAT